MPIDRIHLVGAGGHAKVVIDALLCAGWRPGQITLWTETEAQVGTSIAGLAVGRLNARALRNEAFHICIGNNEVRGRLHATLCEAGAIATTIIHPAAIMSVEVRIGAGSFVAARAILAPDTTIGISCIVNHGAIVDHDCIVGDFAHVAPGATLAGAVRVGSKVLVGAGANLLPGISVAERSTVGAGAVVLTNVPSNSVFAGMPARRIR